LPASTPSGASPRTPRGAVVSAWGSNSDSAPGPGQRAQDAPLRWLRQLEGVLPW
jgi:hypothetical protein